MWQPVTLLMQLARYPVGYDTFLAKTHTVSQGDVAELAPVMAVLLMPPVLVPELRNPLSPSDGKEIDLVALYLLHQDELDVKIIDGGDTYLSNSPLEK